MEYTAFLIVHSHVECTVKEKLVLTVLIKHFILAVLKYILFSHIYRLVILQVDFT